MEPYLFLFCLLIFWMLSLLTAIFELRHDLHMLQLSSYQFQGYFRTLKHSFVRERLFPVLSLICFVAMLCAPHDSPFLMLPVTLFEAVTLFVFRPQKAKKKFVMTPRVKRLCVTIAVLVVLCALLHAPSGADGWYVTAFFFIWAPAIGLSPFLVALANLINLPVEKSINNGFIRDAVRILNGQPKLRIIGVTGSYGKTSVKYYLNTILSEQFNTLMTPESYNTPMGVVRTIREQMKPVHEIFICEMGARHVGDIKEITDFVHPDDGVLTAIGEQHMETFFTQENIVKTKYELLDAVAEKHPESSADRGGMKFVNGDNTFIRANMKYPDAITYGLSEGNDFRAVDLRVTGAGTTFKIRLSERAAALLKDTHGYMTDHAVKAAADGAIPEDAGTAFHTILVGAHNIQNITGAIAVAVMYGMQASKIRMGVRRIEAVPHRLEVKRNGSVTILDDAFNSNPAGAKAALDTLAMFENAVKILVTPGMVELGAREDELNAAFGSQAAKVCDYIILVGEKQTEAIRRGVLQAGFDEERLFVRERFEDASRLMYELDAGKEKVILLENDLPDNY
ncbi:MAG: UDP-N-acetylmuramoyl-tripeptide--D-alanyl-D-alanine ligase [Lachnospiraceae bacterium]|nr:UDP-N-acetylmuramoyl-tripeptide--D-alanyl-D-alanine ligase [Lachnospiraceae bacterium]